MKIVAFVVVFFASFVSFSQRLQSPDKQFEMIFKLDEEGMPKYQLSYQSKSVINESGLGLELKNLDGLISGFSVVTTTPSTFKESWSPVLGEYKSIENHYNGLSVELVQTATNRKLNLMFKLLMNLKVMKSF